MNLEFEVEQIVFPPEPQEMITTDIYKIVKSLISVSFGTCGCNVEENVTFKDLYATEGKFKNLLENFRVRYNFPIPLQETLKWNIVMDMVDYLKNNKFKP